MAADQHRRALAEEIERVLRKHVRAKHRYDPMLAQITGRGCTTLQVTGISEAAAEIAALSGREVEVMREAAAKAVLGTSYGPPSHWPASYPRGWRHPPLWSAGRTPTPEEACWHDNGVNDAYFAIRALTQEGRSDG